LTIIRKHTNRRMSEIVIHGDTIYLAGQVGETSQGIAAQTAETLAHIDRLLVEAGSSREHILQVIIWLKDIADFEGMDAVYDAWVPEGHAPVRATSEAKLADPSLLVEIIVTAARF
jgi:enamine deaminase RidA (YjgF/YER057c/UK114 family)